MNYLLIPAGLLLSCAVVVGGSAQVAPTSRPTSAASRLSAGELERARDATDVAATRAHGWALWTELNSPDPKGMPRWIGWAGSGEILRHVDAHFGSGGDPSSRPATDVRLGGERVSPTSQTLARRGGSRSGGAHDGAGASARGVVRRPEPAVSIYFNPAAAEHMRRNGYDAPGTFATLKEDLDRAGAPPAARTIAAFPREAVAVKAMWRIVRGAPAAGEVWVLPTWDPETAKASGAAAALPPSKWRRSVVIDFSGRDVPPDETVEVNLPGQPRVSRVVSIDRFFHITLDARQAADLDASAGDTAILVGLHVATKELPTWVWATYWWHDRPDLGEFAAGRPEAISRGVWGNYLMNIDLGDPAGSGGGARFGDGGSGRRAVFNPWLEGGLKGGTASNCLSCHQQASLTAQLLAAPFAPVRATPRSDGDAVFRDRIRTDFVWSVAGVGVAGGGSR
jgi:hypothetical protein